MKLYKLTIFRYKLMLDIAKCFQNGASDSRLSRQMKSYDAVVFDVLRVPPDQFAVSF